MMKNKALRTSQQHSRLRHPTKIGASKYFWFRMTLCSVAALPHGLSTVHYLFLTTAVVLIPPSSPPYPIQNEAYELRKQNRSDEADDTTQSASERQHPNWVPNTATRGLRALLPGLSSTHY